MLATQSAVFPVPASLGVILQIREGGAYQRTLCFTNLSANELAISFEESADSGETWTLIGTAFTLGVAGSATSTIVKDTTSTGILRVRASGGGDDRDVEISYMRVIDEADTGRVWAKPSI